VLRITPRPPRPRAILFCSEEAGVYAVVPVVQPRAQSVQPLRVLDRHILLPTRVPFQVEELHRAVAVVLD
jgi:hypothetical protein